MAVGLPYDMGNAGDLLKHGVLAEFVRWQCEMGIALRFMDPFGGEPWEQPVPEVARRIQALTGSALHAAQARINDGRYYGSGFVALHTAAAAGCDDVRVLTGDICPARRERLHACGLSMLDEEFPHCGAGATGHGYDGYDAVAAIVRGSTEGDLVLIDPFSEFLPRQASAIVPQMTTMAKRAAVLLFALNLDPRNRVGRQFDALLEEHMPGAWRMTCPPLHGTAVRGEGRYHAEVLLSARPLLEPEEAQEVDVLWERLTRFAELLAGVFGLPKGRLKPRVVGR